MSQDIIFISDARLSFPHLAEMQTRTNTVTGKTNSSYNCDLILPENNPGWNAFMQRFAVLAAEQGKEHANQLMQMINNDPKSRCYADGSEKINKRTFQVYEGYMGNKSITVANKKQFQMIGPDGKPIDPINPMAWQAAARKLYGGCRVNAAIKPWWQKANPQQGYGHGIRCDLIAIQFLRDDVPFGEGDAAAPDGMFGAVAGAQPQFGQQPQTPMPGAPFNTAGTGQPQFGQQPQFVQQAAPFQQPGMPSFLG